jgi:hypothetical protein
VAVGHWPVTGGRWPLAGGRWPVAVGRWPLAGSQYPMARPMGYDYGFPRSLNGRSGTADNGKEI